MLKKIPKIISPELLKAMCEMGHGDTMAIADAAFPAATCGRDALVVRAEGTGAREMLEAVLELFPLDTYDGAPAITMSPVPGDAEPEIRKDFMAIAERHDGRSGGELFAAVERMEFYQRARRAHVIVATGEEAAYANVILRKGHVK